MGRPIGSKGKAFHVWTDEEKRYLKKITPGHHYKEIQDLMNEKCELNFTLSQIKGAISRYKLNTGFSGCFEKGNIPFNRGMKGICAKGSEKTWFKKGQSPVNHRPIGSERIDVDGYTLVKVAEPNKWRLKQQIVWKEHCGVIPKGYVLIFADGDKTNFEIRNLLLVSREKLLMMNRNNLIQADAELTKTGTIIADVLIKISERKRVKR